jgi:hypothetical protein
MYFAIFRTSDSITTTFLNVGSCQERLEGGEGHEGEGELGQGGKRHPQLRAAAANKRKDQVCLKVK